MRSTHLLIFTLIMLCASSACRSGFDIQDFEEEDESQWSLESSETTPTIDPAPMVDPVEPTPSEPAPVVEPAPIEPDPVEAPRPALAECEIEQLWWHEEGIHQLGSPLFGLSPEMGALVNGRSDYNSWGARRTRDGELMYAGYRQRILLDMSETWSRELTVRHDEKTVLEVTDRASNDILWSREASPYNVAAELSRDGTRVATLGCGPSTREEYQRYTIGLHGVGDDAFIFEQSIEVERCHYWFGYGNNLAISDDGERMAGAYRELVLSEDEQRYEGHVTIHVISEQGMSSYELDALDESYTYEGYIASMNFDPSGRMLHVVDIEGKHTVIDVEKEEIMARGERGAFITNWNSYLPSLPQSPMVWGGDGQVIASVNTRGEVELVDTMTGEEFFTLPAPELTTPGRFIPDEHPNAPVNIAFSAEGDVMFVAFNQGVGAWGCAGALPGERASFSSLEARGPAMALTSHPVTFEVDHVDDLSTSIVGIKVYVDGQLHQSFADDEAITVRFYREQTHEVVIEVDNGFDVMQSEPMMITVIAAE